MPFTKNVMAAAEAYKAMGAEVFEISLPLVEYALPIYYILVRRGFLQPCPFRWCKVRLPYPNAGDDIIELYTKSRSEGFGAEVQRRIMLGTYVLSSGYYDAYYKRLVPRSTRSARKFANALEKCDVIPDAGCADHGLRDRLQDHQSARDVCRRYLHGSVNIAGLLGSEVQPCGFDENHMRSACSSSVRASASRRC